MVDEFLLKKFNVFFYFYLYLLIIFKEIIEFIFEMSEALMVLEKHKVFHRDIKPSNILVCADGSFKLG
jgi:serine/threonine protein kinase